ncbi:hypothetical protein LTR65_010005 [Meristemomyces frigidus]
MLPAESASGDATEIYSHLCDDRDTVHLDVLENISLVTGYHADPLNNEESQAVQGVGLLQTCRAIHEEFRPLLYKSIIFSLDVEDGETLIFDNREVLDLGSVSGCQFLRHAQNVQLSIHRYDMNAVTSTLVQRIEAVLAAMESGQHLKKLAIHLHINVYDGPLDAEPLCRALEGIKCGGHVTVGCGVRRSSLSYVRAGKIAARLGGRLVGV